MKTSTQRTHQGIRRTMTRLLLLLALALGSLVAVAPSASAATWHVTDRSVACNGGSWGMQCTETTTWRRHHLAYCDNGPIGPWTAVLAWYQTCTKTTTRTYWQ